MQTVRSPRAPLAAPSRTSRRTPAAPARALFGLGGKKDDNSRFSDKAREEQWRLQQEILSRRRSGTWKKDVEERRTKVSRYLRDPTFKKEVDKERSARFKATQEAEAKQREEEAKKGVINVPFFTVPFNIPEYDGGERFDLRLPYVDNGYVDEDADPVKQFRQFIGLDKKEEK